MTEQRIKIAIIGSGPAGLSAAAHAAELGISHRLFEKTAKHADTIQKYQKGKHVMATPDILPLRSPLPFAAGKRESILHDWLEGLKAVKTQIAYQSEVSGIQGQQGDFTITCANGQIWQAEYIILGIGVQGNPRKLGVEGQDHERVQYQLDDPEAYRDESIVVVGAGDAAIENAIALAAHNTVYIINRRDEFARAKEGNLNLITTAIDRGEVHCRYRSSPKSIQADPNGKPMLLELSTENGSEQIACDRIIARLGAIPQRALVESFGIEFPNDAPNAVPELSGQYESNVPGLYVVGALAGYPLIKQAMNQGYEVVEYILGNDIEPADHPILANKYQALPYDLSVDDILSMMQSRIPVFQHVNALQFRELMLESNVHVLKKGQKVFRKNDYGSSFFTILEGETKVDLGDKRSATLTQGDFFGEMGLLSGRRRNATVLASKASVLIETNRRAMIKLINSNDAVRAELDRVFILRALQTHLAKNATLEDLAPIADAAEIRSYATDEVIFHEAAPAESLALIRSGSVRIEKNLGAESMVLAYVPANQYVGEMGLLANANHANTVRANVRTEVISLDKANYQQLLSVAPGLEQSFKATAAQRIRENTRIEANADRGNLIHFLMNQGLGEATDVLLIDETLCVACDNCEKACADTHQGVSRLDRAAGPSFASIHLPTACRHCEHPHCMKDCPPDAIHRAADGEVYISDACIGCGNCEQNCPYDVIRMAAVPPAKPPLWQWLMFGRGHGPGEAPKVGAQDAQDSVKKAMKCDLCKDSKAGPACVRACPTGAAMRISPEQFTGLTERKNKVNML